MEVTVEPITTETLVHTPISEPSPTDQVYAALQSAYRHFNTTLFGNRLPGCLITLQRRAGTLGYFSPDKFASQDGDMRTDEIALNPAHFRVHTPKETCSTLVHEMAHLAQQHFGKPSAGGYHNRQWAAAMVAIGFQPSSTGAPGGKETGYRVSHYIVPGGPFDVSFTEFEATGQAIGWGDAFVRGNGGEPPKPKRLKFVCPGGCRENFLATPATFMHCGPCGQRMIPQVKAAR